MCTRACPQCPLCGSDDTRFIHRSDDRHGIRVFYECAACDLAFVPAEYHLPESVEVERYRMHDNDPNDEGYRNFLSRLWKELAPRLRPGAAGLDFGCGPGPALAHMMREDGFEVALYDPYFFPDASQLDRRYDFITCTETVEHLRDPATTFGLLDTLLLPNGQLGVMTGMLEDRAGFASWYYQRDPTHICFYTRKTMSRIADLRGWTADFPTQNVTIFRRRP